MDVREKLVEIVCKGMEVDGCIGHCNHPPCFAVERVVNALIAHGVTVQEWVSVKDRLPEDWIKVLVFAPSIDAIIPANLRGGSWYSTWDSTRLENMSYWMPMPEKPQPPKGERWVKNG